MPSVLICIFSHVFSNLNTSRTTRNADLFYCVTMETICINYIPGQICHHLFCRKKSMELVRQRHPSWSDSLIEEIARLEYETAAQQVMEGTVLLVQKLRPKSSWGFYGFPNCYNNRDSVSYNCSKLTIQRNDQISWMFESSSALFPSIYLHDVLHGNSTLFVKYRLLESFKRAKQLDGHSIPVYPYVRITYAISQIYLNEASNKP